MYVYCLIKYPDGEPMIVEISPSSVAEAPDTTYSASHTSTAKPSVTPINSALMAYHAQVRQKRSLEEPSGEKPNASAMKYRAVGPLHDISSGKVGANSGNSARVSTFSSPPRTLTPRPTFSPICEEVKTVVADREHCLDYQSTRGCTFKRCKFIHTDPTIGSQAWYTLRKNLRILNASVIGDLIPRPYLGLKSFTLTDAARTEEGRSLVDYCYRSFFNLGCFNETRCTHCHDLPIEDCQEWELLKVGLARVAQRNRVDVRGLDFTDCIQARRLTIAGALAKDLSSLPSPSTRNEPCIYYFSTFGCWSPSCCYTHPRPGVGSVEWKRLRERVEHLMSLSGNAARFKLYHPIGYLGMAEGFKTHVEGPGRFPQRKLVEYCLPSFTTKGCVYSRCNRCHDLPIECSEDWGYLRDALLSDISQRKLVDDPAFDVLPVIKARGVTIRHHDATEHQPQSVARLASEPARHLISSLPALPPCLHHFSTKGCGKAQVCHMLHLTTPQPPGSPEWFDLRLALENEA